MSNRTSPDLLRTTKLPVLSMAELVYGPRHRRFRLPTRLIFIAAFLGASIGCATAVRPVAVETETVGQLSASYHSVASAPVHADTDLTPGFGAVDTDEDAAPAISAQVDGGGDAELPEVAPKTDGVTAGTVRQ